MLYIVDTVDEIIYAKEDWSDLTGEAANQYWVWPLDPDAPPERRDAPPLTPRPTEEQEWERLGRRAPQEPVEWLGVIPDREYSVDTTGTVTTRSGAVVTNPQGVDEMILRLRDRPGGRFYVTPAHHLVIAWGQHNGESTSFAIGQLAEPFALLDSVPSNGEVPAVSSLRPGDPYTGPSTMTAAPSSCASGAAASSNDDKGREVEAAFDEGTGRLLQEQNARALLDAWRSLARPGMTVKVNHAGHAWYLDAGQPRYLASVEGGFVFPSDLEKQDGGRQVG